VNDQLYTISGDEIHAWNTLTGQPVTPPLKYRSLGGIQHFSFDPEGQYLVSSSSSGSMIWSLKDRKQVKLLEPSLTNRNHTNHAVFSPNGKLVVTASSDKTARVWNAEQGYSLIHTLRHQATVNKVAISNDGQWIATASDDMTARVWNASTGLPAFPPLIHRQRIGHVSFSSDSQRVLTSSADNTARVWSAQTGQPVSPWLANNGPLHCTAFSSDGRRVLTTDRQTAVIWNLPIETRPTPDLLKLAQIYAGHKIDDTGGLQPLDINKELLPWYNEMKAKHPDEFTPNYEDTRRWRKYQIELCCTEGNLPAALFHQNWLLAEAVLEAAKAKK